jgi:DNA transformation protein
MVKSKNDYADFIVDKLAGLGDVSYQRLFGGYGVSCEELTFALIADDTLYFKVDDSNREMYDIAGAGYFPHPISYREVPTEVFEDMAKLYEWAEISIGIAKEKAKAKQKKKRG